MSSIDVEGAIEEFVRREFAVSPTDEGFGRHAHLFDEGYVDSVGVIELLEFIKQEFGVEIPDEDLFSPDFSTVAGIGAIIARLAHD